MLTLRSYQQEASDKIVEAVISNLPGGSIVSLPTGSGKSLVIADVTNRLQKNTLIICPSREILEQDRAELLEFIPPAEVGTYSASLKTKTIKKYTFATIGSIYRKPELFQQFGLLILDECDLYPPEKGMFITFFKNLQGSTLIGLTATPYRLVSKKRYYSGIISIETSLQMLTKIAPAIWRRIIYSIDNWVLVKSGYITPLKVVNELPLLPFEEIKESSNDFNLKSYAYYSNRNSYRIIENINRAKSIYKSVLVFCCTIEQANQLSTMVEGSTVVTSETKDKERKIIIEDFKSGKTKVVFNVGVLTCGFNHPGLDCIVLLRPTKSVRLFYQICGRAVRKCAGKSFGTIVDLTDSTKNIGRIETIQVMMVNGEWGLYTSKGRIDGKILYKYEREL
jgi:DNA repair protein RadD